MTLFTLAAFFSYFSLTFAQARVRFAGHYSLGPARQHIVWSETTLWPGKTPSPQRDRLALWAGCGTDTGNLIQAIIVSNDKERAQCRGNPGQWCVFASVLQGGRQRIGKQYALDPNKGVTVRYDYKDSGVTDQTVSVDGRVVSTISLSSGKAKGWGTAIECQDAACGTLMGPHKYTNTTIKLVSADMDFKRTAKLDRVDATPMTTADNGLTWKIETINVLATTRYG